MPTYESCEKCGIDKPVGFECPWRAIKTLEAERDRYREALDHVRQSPHALSCAKSHDCLCHQCIATRALKA